jgi:hypothetical protein
MGIIIMLPSLLQMRRVIITKKPDHYERILFVDIIGLPENPSVDAGRDDQYTGKANHHHCLLTFF